MNAVNAIETHRLGKRYGRTWALRDCTLAIPAGRVVALVGPNGAGKTTLLHMAVGLTTPAEGRITVLDGHVPGSREALAQVGFVAQDMPLYPGLSVADTLRLVAGLSGFLDEDEARDRLDALGIPRDRKVGRLSGGQRAQVALAVALARRPRLLILDEPLASLDPLARHEFTATLMAAVAEREISVLFSSHVVAELERVCDHLIVLAGGRVQVAGDVTGLIEDHQVLTGPAADADAIRAAFPVVREGSAEGPATFLIRGGALPAPPPGWTSRPAGLEELVLSYLRVPGAAEPGTSLATATKEAAK